MPIAIGNVQKFHDAHSEQFFRTPLSYDANIKLDVAKNLLEVKPKFLAPSRPRMNASNMWSEFVKPNYNENTHVQKNLILNMKM